MAAGTPAYELRELNSEELTTRLREAKEELFNLRFQMATGQPSPAHGQARHRPHLHRYPRA